MKKLNYKDRKTLTAIQAIQARGTRSFSAAEIALESGLCRQTVYKIIRELNGRGNRIRGESGVGFMARMEVRN